MSSNQNKLFWYIFISFCICATIAIYPQGAFDNISLASAAILFGFYLLVALFIYIYIKSNPEQIDKWFEK